MFVEYYEVADIIQKENPNVKPQKILAGSPMILNYDPSRVRVIVNIKDVCISPPKVG